MTSDASPAPAAPPTTLRYQPRFSETAMERRKFGRVNHHSSVVTLGVNVAGIDHVGFGSDFDGGSYLLDDARQVPQITQGLAARGWSEPHLRQFLGLNHLRAFRQVCG